MKTLPDHRGINILALTLAAAVTQPVWSEPVPPAHQHSDMNMAAMPGDESPSGTRSPDYSDGYDYGDMGGMNMSESNHAMLLLDKLEYVHSDAERGQRLDARGWYGGDIDKLWIKVSGERSDGSLENLRSEALWDHAISPFWSLQTGWRHDNGGGPSRDWAAFGVQGLAPYWFEVDATGYIGTEGRSAARVEVEYEILFSQKLILTPDLEVNFYGKDDPERELGSGLANAEFGLRLRYEVRREFAPYVGVSWNRSFGNTYDYRRDAGMPGQAFQIVGGVRIWY